MKKFIVSVISLIAACSVTAFTACAKPEGDSSSVPEQPAQQPQPAPQEKPAVQEVQITPVDGEIKGEYSPCEAQRAAEYIANSSLKQIIEDPSSWAAGLEYATETTVGAQAIRTVLDTYVFTKNYSVDLGASLKVAFGSEGLICGGNGILKYNMDGLKNTLQADVYAETSALYVRLQDSKMKIPYSYITDSVKELLSGLFQDGEIPEEGQAQAQSMQASPSAEGALQEALVKLKAEFTAENLASLMAEFNITPYLDLSNGVKIKLELGTESILRLLSEKFPEAPVAAESFTCSLYLALDGEYNFLKAGICTESSFTISLPSSSVGQTTRVELQLKDNSLLSLYTGTVPAFDDLENYVDISLQ